jgi:hypothetical protein
LCKKFTLIPVLAFQFPSPFREVRTSDKERYAVMDIPQQEFPGIHRSGKPESAAIAH